MASTEIDVTVNGGTGPSYSDAAVLYCRAHWLIPSIADLNSARLDAHFSMEVQNGLYTCSFQSISAWWRYIVALSRWSGRLSRRRAAVEFALSIWFLSSA